MAIARGDLEAATQLHIDLTGDDPQTAERLVAERIAERFELDGQEARRDTDFFLVAPDQLSPDDPTYKAYLSALARGDIAGAEQLAAQLRQKIQPSTDAPEVAPLPDPATWGSSDEFGRGVATGEAWTKPAQSTVDPADRGFSGGGGVDGRPDWIVTTRRQYDHQLQTLRGKQNQRTTEDRRAHDKRLGKLRDHNRHTKATHMDRIREEAFGRRPSGCPDGTFPCQCPEAHNYVWCHGEGWQCPR